MTSTERWRRETCRSTFEEEEEIDVAAVEQEIERLEAELAEVRVKMKAYLKELGV